MQARQGLLLWLFPLLLPLLLRLGAQLHTLAWCCKQTAPAGCCCCCWRCKQTAPALLVHGMCLLQGLLLLLLPLLLLLLLLAVAQSGSCSQL